MKKRSWLYLLLVVVVAGWIGTLISRDPGYVLLTWEGYSLQTSLWVFIALIAFVLVSGYYGLKWLRILLNSGGFIKNWQSERSRRRASELTARGVRFLAEGEYERARRFLLTGIGGNETPESNHLALAEVSHLLGQAEERENHCRQALEINPDLRKAIATLRARLFAADGDWQDCLRALSEAGDNMTTQRLKKEALLGIEDWHGLQQLLPKLRKSDDVSEIERLVATAKLQDASSGTGEKKKAYKQLTAVEQDAPETILSFVEGLPEKEAESILRTSLKSSWQRELLVSYGQLGTETLDKRLKQVNSWQKRHTDDADLHLCRGLLLELKGDRTGARESYERSNILSPSRLASERLAHLSAFNGDYQQSNEFYKAALRLD